MANADEAVLAAGDLRPLAEALHAGNGRRAVHLFLRALEIGLVPAAGPLLHWLRERLGDAGLSRLVLAFATLRCLHCRGGFSACDACRKTGRAEAKAEACLTCMGLGVAPCDFCGGSGWMPYGSVPGGLRAVVATTRTRLAVASLARLQLQQSEKAQLQANGITQQLLAKALPEARRALGTLTNAAVLASEMRQEDPRLREFTARLFSRSRSGAKVAQRLLGRLFLQLAERSRNAAEAPDKDGGSRSFELDRAAQLEREGNRLRSAATHCSSLFPGH